MPADSTNNEACFTECRGIVVQKAHQYSIGIFDSTWGTTDEAFVQISVMFGCSQTSSRCRGRSFPTILEGFKCLLPDDDDAIMSVALVEY
jgi:hypothetical protein